MIKYVGLIPVLEKKKKKFEQGLLTKKILSLLCALAMVIYRSIHLQMCTSNNCKNKQQRNVMKWIFVNAESPFFMSQWGA